MNEPCVVCQVFGGELMPATSLVSIETTLPDQRARVQLPDAHGARAARLCPEHVVDVYRGRIDGVSMAWRIVAAPVAVR